MVPGVYPGCVLLVYSWRAVMTMPHEGRGQWLDRNSVPKTSELGDETIFGLRASQEMGFLRTIND